MGRSFSCAAAILLVHFDRIFVHLAKLSYPAYQVCAQEGAAEHAHSTKVIHVLSRPLSFVPGKYSRTKCAGAAQAAFGRFRRHAEPPGDFPNRQIFEISQQPHFAMGRRKRLDRIDQVHA
ncbi:MAG TPA: hypothetical protein VKT99_09600 [Xanthobacteraceae bacterium]|jgi:hypothetical protein|nr:hypothetical protein [Xanthobacteraceae bacterium]